MPQARQGSHVIACCGSQAYFVKTGLWRPPDNDTWSTKCTCTITSVPLALAIACLTTLLTKNKYRFYCIPTHPNSIIVPMVLFARNLYYFIHSTIGLFVQQVIVLYIPGRVDLFVDSFTHPCSHHLNIALTQRSKQASKQTHKHTNEHSSKQHRQQQATSRQTQTSTHTSKQASTSCTSDSCKCRVQV